MTPAWTVAVLAVGLTVIAARWAMAPDWTVAVLAVVLTVIASRRAMTPALLPLTAGLAISTRSHPRAVTVVVSATSAAMPHAPGLAYSAWTGVAAREPATLTLPTRPNVGTAIVGVAGMARAIAATCAGASGFGIRGGDQEST